MNVFELERYCHTFLSAERFRDYCPNGLQVEGRHDVQTIVTGVTASQKLLDSAVALQADLVLVHHGYFWKNEAMSVRGMKKQRLATLLKHDINMMAYHLPLDAHPEVGNNAQLARQLGIRITGLMNPQDAWSVGNVGELDESVEVTHFAAHVEAVLGRKPLVVSGTGGSRSIKRIALCTGGAQGYIDQAIACGVDAYISGEISESTPHTAQENGMHYFAAGHHATERYGVQALGEHLSEQFGLRHVFVDHDNPA